MSSTRNHPCPCGSGIKHKKCCLSPTPKLEAKATIYENKGDHVEIFPSTQLLRVQIDENGDPLLSGEAQVPAEFIGVLERVAKDHQNKQIPEKLNELFNSKKKKDAQRIASALTVSYEEFSDAILNAKVQKSYQHEFIKYEFQPSWFSGKIGALLAQIPLFKRQKKLLQFFRERKMRFIHFFVKNEIWHCFFFSPNDSFIRGAANHYKLGEHIHYVSYLWGFNLETVKSKLSERSHTVDSEHVRVTGWPETSGSS